jgi:DNA-binding transcriptional MerR regulator
MATTNLIPADEVLTHHQLEQTFIHSLQDEGLITVSIVNKKTFIPQDELQKLETMIHLHRDLEINVAGIASISHLLQQMDNLQEQMWLLRNRLRRYEEE